MVAPISDELLDAMFSTRTPNTDGVAAAVAKGKLDLYGRGRGTYIVDTETTRRGAFLRRPTAATEVQPKVASRAA